MKNKINKEYNYSFILTEENFKRLIDFLNKYYTNIYFSIKAIDGVEIELNYKELIDYDNYNDEKIIGLKVEGNRKEKEKEKDSDFIFFFDNSIEISFGVNGFYKYFENNSIQYTIKETNNTDFKTLKEGLEKIIENDFKIYYTILNTSIVYSLINITLVFILIVLFIYIFNINKYNELYIPTTIILSILGFLIIQSNSYKNIYRFFFPKYIFALGKQKEQVKIKEYFRNIFFVGIILSLIIGVIVNKIS